MTDIIDVRSELMGGAPGLAQEGEEVGLDVIAAPEVATHNSEGREYFPHSWGKYLLTEIELSAPAAGLLPLIEGAVPRDAVGAVKESPTIRDVVEANEVALGGSVRFLTMGMGTDLLEGRVTRRVPGEKAHAAGSASALIFADFIEARDAKESLTGKQAYLESLQSQEPQSDSELKSAHQSDIRGAEKAVNKALGTISTVESRILI